MMSALLVAYFGIQLGLESLRYGDGTIDGQPAFVAIAFGTVALVAALLDLRMILAGGIKGAHRLARHLWRMCFALFLAAASFFLGQAQVFPEAVRQPALLAAPVVLVLVIMLYYLIRLLLQPKFRGAYRLRKAALPVGAASVGQD